MPTLRELLDLSWSFCRRHGAAVLTIVLLVYTPIDLVLETIPYDEDLLRSFRRYIRVAIPLEIFVGVFCTMAIAHLVLADREGRSLSVKDAFWLAASRWPASVATQIIATLLFVAGLLLFVLPGIYIWVATIFTVPLVALRGLWGIEAIKASLALVRGRWWAVFRLLILLGLIDFAVTVVALLPYAFLPEHFVIEVVFSLVIDVITAFFLVVIVHWMLALESAAAARAEMPPAAAMDPAV